VTGQPIDPLEVVIWIDHDRSALDRDMPVPSIATEHGERNSRVNAKVRRRRRPSSIFTNTRP
jgi:hypothetical protein